MGLGEADEPSRHRDDLQGLRAVAVLLVVLCHAGVPFLSGGYGGVDVFFVLSGYLITRLLLAQAARDGRISLVGFYVRRARRILPAAVLTLVATDVAAYCLLNFVRARDAVADSIWSSLFAANVHFADVGANYFARAQPPSPVRHFWSLAVEEQFYLVWPVLLGILLLVARRAPDRIWIAVLLLALASLAWSIHSTATSPATAYFSAFARAWELALGALLALAWPRLERLRGRAFLGWLGLACIAASAVAFSSRTSFPGYAALLPTGGAALVIAGRTTLLATAPFRYVGDRSYALYLWHWPVLVIAAEYVGHPLSTATKLVLVAGAFALSVVSYALVENPIRRMSWRPRAGMLLWPVSAAVVLAFAVPILASLGRTAARIEAASAALTPRRLLDPAVSAERARRLRPLPAVVAAVRAVQRGEPLPSPLVPAVGSLHNDWYRFPSGCAAGRGQTSSNVCRLGSPGARKTLVVIGDSHAAMWMGVVVRMGARDGWSVAPFVKPACVPRRWAEGGECGAWYRWAIARAAGLRPAATLIAGSWMAAWGPRLAVVPVVSLATTMKRYSASVIVVGDTPGQRRDPVDCLLAPRSTMSTCSRTVAPAKLQADDLIASRVARRGIGFVDTRGWFCAHPSHHPSLYTCPLVVNRTITAVDRGHVSQTYALELADSFRAAFRRELFR